jgi:hypothetical protein
MSSYGGIYPKKLQHAQEIVMQTLYSESQIIFKISDYIPWLVLIKSPPEDLKSKQFKDLHGVS